GSNYPLRLMGRVYDSWMYDGDPLYHLRINHHLAQLRERVKQDPTYLASLLQKMIVENRHVTLTAFVPDKAYFAKQNAEAEAELAELKKGMSREKLDAIVREAAERDAMQSAPNTPEALATLPR